MQTTTRFNIRIAVSVAIAVLLALATLQSCGPAKNGCRSTHNMSGYSSILPVLRDAGPIVSIELIPENWCVEHNSMSYWEVTYKPVGAGLLKAITDERGFTSVSYMGKDGRESGYDYLTQKELAELIISLK